MESDVNFIKTGMQIGETLRTAKFLLYSKLDPEEFEPSGIWAFCGGQGQGKTLSAVKCVLDLHRFYPMAKIVSNIHLMSVPYEPFTDYAQIAGTSNGIYGVIFLIDEIHSIYNSLESKNIPLGEMTAFCQNRKDRRVIVCTAQKYKRIAKPVREQFKYVVDCKKWLRIVQRNTIYDAFDFDENGDPMPHCDIKKNTFVHSIKDYTCYNSHQKVRREDVKR